MTTDRREAILERTFALLSDLTIPLIGSELPNQPTAIVPGHVVRNQHDLPQDKVPGIILLDADEVRMPNKTMPERGQKENGVPDQIMRMTPEIYVVLDVRGTTNPNVGEDLNTARLAILAAVLPDPGLQDIVGANGNIVYDGCITDLARNRSLKGQLGISITFTYPLKVSEYVTAF